MSKLRGARDIPSIMRSGQSRGMRAQYEYEILNELAQLSREKEWLNKEKKKWEDRIERIDARLRDIAKQAELLQRRMAPREEIAPDAQDAKQTVEKEGREVVVRY